MKIKVEPYGKTIGVDDSITKAFMSKDWALLLTIIGYDNKSKQEFILDLEDAEKLISDIGKSIKQIEVISEK